MQLTQFISEREGFAIRAVHLDEQEWFIAKDVCDVLGVKNSRKATANLEEDERHDVTISDAIGRQQVTSSVNESGLYALILRSKKPQARAFRKWVTSEVLPTIRKTGGYSVGGDPVEIVKVELDRFTKRLINIGVPEVPAIRAAKSALRSKLTAMKQYLADQPVNGERGPQSLPHDNRTSFVRQFKPEEILALLTEPMFPTQLKIIAMRETGMSRSSFQRLLAQLRADGKVRYLPGTYQVERVFVEGGAQ